MPWGFNEVWGWSSAGWRSDLAAQQIGEAAAIMPDSLGTGRFPVQWADVESSAGSIRLEDLRRGVSADGRSSLSPVIVLYNAPTWARDPEATCPTHRGPARIRRFPHTTADGGLRRSSRGALPGRQGHRDLERAQHRAFLGPGGGAAALRRAPGGAHDAVEAAGSSAPVITGGLAPTPTTETGLSAAKFMREIYGLGCACDFEGIGAHPILWHLPLLERLWNHISGLTTVRDEQGDAPDPALDHGGERHNRPERRDGDELGRRRGKRSLSSTRSIEGHDMRSFIIHRFQDVPEDGWFWSQTGVVFQDLTPKPAYCELAASIGDSCPEATVAAAITPDTTIAKGPKKKTKRRRARFEFTASEPGMSFECNLDGGQFQSCTSPFNVKVKAGKHTFSVRATNGRVELDPSPAAHSWKVKKRNRNTATSSFHAERRGRSDSAQLGAAGRSSGSYSRDARRLGAPEAGSGGGVGSCTSPATAARERPKPAPGCGYSDSPAASRALGGVGVAPELESSSRFSGT